MLHSLKFILFWRILLGHNKFWQHSRTAKWLIQTNTRNREREREMVSCTQSHLVSLSAVIHQQTWTVRASKGFTYSPSAYLVYRDAQRSDKTIQSILHLALHHLEMHRDRSIGLHGNTIKQLTYFYELFVSVWLSVCLSVWLSACLAGCARMHWCGYMCVDMCAFVFVCLV